MRRGLFELVVTVPGQWATRQKQHGGMVWAEGRYSFCEEGSRERTEKPGREMHPPGLVASKPSLLTRIHLSISVSEGFTSGLIH